MPYIFVVTNSEIRYTCSIISIYFKSLTIVDAVTIPNIGTPALAKAVLAAIIAAANEDPALSKTIAYTSTWKLGNSC